MALIKDSSVREVVAAADMVEVVSGRTPLRRAGARYSGRCPFHEERTPSFSVNAVEKLYHCFGCGKGGDVITFVRETENLDFAGAVEWLAERFRVSLEYEESSPQIEESRKRRERLHAVLDQAAAFYERHLWETSAGEPVRAYLESRRLGEEVCREFRLGLSPGGGLAGKAQERGFTADELRAAGLTNARGNDYFPQRLMFPLADARGRIVGFQARKLHEDDPLRGKYVNSPESELFHKSALLYGLHLARIAIAKQERAVVVEGNTDVIALRQASFEPVVASMGTALTERQLKELQRLTRRIFLCFDSDAAGEEATLRGMELASTLGFDVRVVTLGKGEDPADAPQGFEERLGRAESYVVYRVRLELERAPDRQEAFVRAREVLARIDDSPERQDALRLLADKLDLPRETLSGLAPRRATRGRTLADDLSPKMLAKGDRLERDALAACLLQPSLVKLLAELSPEHFDAELHRRFRSLLVDGGEEDAELVALRAELDARAAREGLDERTGKELLLNLRERRLRRELAHAELDRVKELQTALTRVQDAILELA
ncbi:MAG: DNA primase [Actinobacteria bacterium]|nr:DNA primase [Actinomycetota bacterium]